MVMSAMQLLSARYVGFPAAVRSTTATVQAPQSPSAQPHLLPVRPERRNQSSSVVVGAMPSTITSSPFNVNSNKSVIAVVCDPTVVLLIISVYSPTASGQPKAV